MPSSTDVFRLRSAASPGLPRQGRGPGGVNVAGRGAAAEKAHGAAAPHLAHLPGSSEPVPPMPAAARRGSRLCQRVSGSNPTCTACAALAQSREEQKAVQQAEKAAAAGRSVRDKTTFACRMQQTFGSDAIKAAFKETMGVSAARPYKHLPPGLPGAGGVSMAAAGDGGDEGDADAAAAAGATLAAAACPARRRPVRENLHDFLAKKRQIFLVQVRRRRCGPDWRWEKEKDNQKGKTNTTYFISRRGAIVPPAAAGPQPRVTIPSPGLAPTCIDVPRHETCGDPEAGGAGATARRGTGQERGNAGRGRGQVRAGAGRGGLGRAGAGRGGPGRAGAGRGGPGRAGAGRAGGRAQVSAGLECVMR
jgi:hypothetical protein